LMDPTVVAALKALGLKRPEKDKYVQALER
jgi:hypothetical protein